MAGATIDKLSGGRFIFGFGPSGPQVSEGWYGVPYAKPWGRTREYIEVVREIVAREGQVDHQGEHYQLPLPGGEGKPLKLNFHPERNEIPVFVGAIGRKSVEMAAEICDGWIPIFFCVDAFEETWGEHLEAGFAKGGRQRSDLEVSPSLQVAIDGDLEAAKSVVKAGLVLYFGGMGSRKTNFYVDLAHRFGFGDVADEVQRRFQDGDRAGAFEAMPDEIVEATSLVGTEAEVAERVERFRGAGIDRLIVSPVHVERDQQLHTLERLAVAGGRRRTPRSRAVDPHNLPRRDDDEDRSAERDRRGGAPRRARPRRRQIAEAQREASTSLVESRRRRGRRPPRLPVRGGRAPRSSTPTSPGAPTSSSASPSPPSRRSAGSAPASS